MIEKRRENRIACDLTVSVNLRDGFSGALLAGPAPARLHDVSTYGASLITPQIRFGNHHLFYSARDHHPNQVLFIEADAENGEVVSVPVRPIGFDRVLCDETMPFHIGVEFLPGTDRKEIGRLKKLAHEKRRSQKSWWRNFISKIWPPYESEEDEPS
ncbi:MAG: PilZ domain-containing protein [Desulfobacteraceae bacterium]|nr:PilZ domain-containing protein [Desulfobacteraceae bacterium]